MRCERHKSLLYVPFACAIALPVTIAQLFIDCSTVFVKVTPRIFISVWYVCSDIILPVVFYGCDAWSLTAREERKLRVFENMVLRRIGGMR